MRKINTNFSRAVMAYELRFFFFRSFFVNKKKKQQLRNQYVKDCGVECKTLVSQVKVF